MRHPATTLAPQDSNRKPVYTGLDTTNDCSSEMNSVFINTIIFIHDHTLYMRTITPTLAGTCDDVPIFQQSSCLSCSDKPKDIVVAKNVDTFSVTYQPSDTLGDDPYSNTELVIIMLKLSKNQNSYEAQSTAKLLLASSGLGSK